MSTDLLTTRETRGGDSGTSAGAGERLRVAVIIGSTREGRVGAAVARWFATHAQQYDAFELDMVDLLEVPLPVRLTEEVTPELDAWSARIDRADAFVIVTPEYNHGYPAALKHAIDLLYREWHAKPVGFVSYGGVGRGLRAVEQLRQVFAELHAVTLRDSVSVNVSDGEVDDLGWVREHTGASTAAKRLLERLEWWADALHSARTASAYTA
ncbi:NAD(P)H-dependent oxidoreductase [Streptomyces sp. N2-109]|uniref:NAD(P)H-dependent oxidoreductase n=1 Tax=Streptomyces gossypii TaxID=2883101 RepID=A0ABT2JU18_9ACTN|nr:NAD(P)H-dependent oxidoreductase [Streptomyces gossypii]MCT2590784.1 NAD(P)H-dependent oxidoreductase [Streptomyces gossypii]